MATGWETCPQCGRSNSPGSLQCTVCGAKLAGIEEVSETPLAKALTGKIKARREVRELEDNWKAGLMAPSEEEARFEQEIQEAIEETPMAASTGSGKASQRMMEAVSSGVGKADLPLTLPRAGPAPLSDVKSEVPFHRGTPRWPIAVALLNLTGLGAGYLYMKRWRRWPGLRRLPAHGLPTRRETRH